MTATYILHIFIHAYFYINQDGTVISTV